QLCVDKDLLSFCVTAELCTVVISVKNRLVLGHHNVVFVRYRIFLEITDIYCRGELVRSLRCQKFRKKPHTQTHAFMFFIFFDGASWDRIAKAYIMVMKHVTKFAF